MISALLIIAAWSLPEVIPMRGLCTYLDDGIWEYPIANPNWHGDKRKMLAKACEPDKPKTACHPHCGFMGWVCHWHCNFGHFANIWADPPEKIRPNYLPPMDDDRMHCVMRSMFHGESSEKC